MASAATESTHLGWLDPLSANFADSADVASEIRDAAVVTPSEADMEWSAALAKQYDVDELEAMCTWLDVNLALNQQRLESLTSRLGSVVTLGAALLALMATTVKEHAWPLTVIAGIVSSIAILASGTGQRTVVRPDRDPTSTWDSMWGVRRVGELQVVLYRRRSVLFEDQRKAIDERSEALRRSSWFLAFAAVLASIAILVSRF